MKECDTKKKKRDEEAIPSLLRRRYSYNKLTLGRLVGTEDEYQFDYLPYGKRIKENICLTEYRKGLLMCS